MKKISFFLLVLLVTTALGVVLHHYMTTPKEQGVAYLQSAKMDLFSPLSAYSSSYALSEKSKPHELLDLPDGISGNNDDTQFFSLPVGKNRVFVVIHKPGQNTATAWVDTNMNNHLSDEIPLSGKAIKYTENKSNRNYFYFGNVCLKDENISFAPIHLTCLKDRGYIIAQPISYLKGKIKLGGHIYRVAIVDGDYDGQFNTLYSHSEGTQYLACDKIVIDYNTNAFFGRGKYDSGKLVPLGSYYKFAMERYGNIMPMDRNSAECYYSIDLSDDGTKLQMHPAEPTTVGTLKIGKNKRLSARLFSDAATQWVKFEEEIELPIGQYQVRWGQLRYKDDTGHHWNFMPDFHEDVRKGQFEIKKGKTFTINPGPPFTMKTDIRKEGDSLRIGVGLTGNEGEEYGLRLSGSTPVTQLKIFDEDGNEIHSGQMEYG